MPIALCACLIFAESVRKQSKFNIYLIYTTRFFFSNTSYMGKASKSPLLAKT